MRKPGSQTQHRTRNQTGILGAIKHELSVGSALAFFTWFQKNLCKLAIDSPAVNQMLLLTNLVACYLLMPTEDWVPATRWLPVHQSNVIWSALNSFAHSLNACITSYIFTLLMSIFSTFNNLIQWNISMLSIKDCNKNKAGKSGVLGQYESPWCDHISNPEVDLLNVLSTILTSTNTKAYRLESHTKCTQPHFKDEIENNKERAVLCTQPLLLWMIKI